MDSPQGIVGVLQSIQPGRHTYYIDFLFSRIPTGRIDSHLLTAIIVVKHYWVEPCTPTLFVP